MITPQHLIDAVAEEFRIMKHLHSKVTEHNKDHRLTPAQRSIEELEQYIVSSLPAQVKLMVQGNRDQDVYMQEVDKFKDYSRTHFAAALDQAFASISADINTLSDAQRQEEISLRGMTGPRTKFLVDYLLEFLGAYKMQLFLQLKASWLSEIGTYNLRAGIDEPKK